jgi:hypothetical protein
MPPVASLSIFGVWKKSLFESGTLGSMVTEVDPQPWSSVRITMIFGRTPGGGVGVGVGIGVGVGVGVGVGWTKTLVTVRVPVPVR